MNSLIQYMYRDASNYKQFGEFIIDGLITISEIEKFFCDFEFFIPAAMLIDRFRKAADEGWFYEKLSVSERALVLADGHRTGLVNPDWHQLV
jgi:hypothetical protein